MFFIALFFGTIFSLSFGAGPTSNIPSETGYELPCSLIGLSTYNVQSYKVGSNTIPVASITNYSSVTTPKGTIIEANCSEGNYVFNPNRNPGETAARSFKLMCDAKGAFKRVNPDEYCDIKCDISDLKENFGYGIPKTMLDPGEQSTISCPVGKTTKNGDTFKVMCLSDGKLGASSPACFEKANSCKFPVASSPGGIGTFPAGSRLVCTAPVTNQVTTVSCESSKWELNSFYEANKSTCKETIGEINFEIENLNELLIIDIETILTIEEIIDFCVQNPTDKECNATFPECKYSDQSYKMGHIIILHCPAFDAEIRYQCLNTWLFDGFKDEDHPLASVYYVSQEECGSNSYLTESIPPIQPPRSNMQKQNTLRDFANQKYKQQKLKKQTKK